MRAKRRCVLISPCRDKAKMIRRPLNSRAAQTVPTSARAAVDDGSTDKTPSVLEEYQKKLRPPGVVRSAERGRHSVGAGVTETFCAGLETVDLDDFEYLCGLGLDLDLPPRYSERLIARTEATPRLGTTSGKTCFVHPRTGVHVPEVHGDDMSFGATKSYRTTRFREIGGFERELIWDGIDGPPLPHAGLDRGERGR